MSRKLSRTRSRATAWHTAISFPVNAERAKRRLRESWRAVSTVSRDPPTTPCGVCSSCLEISAGSSVDVIEIDAASNRGINEMREIRENVRYRPARDKYKVFIIDEAHQITKEAFNALLKTLEEPPGVGGLHPLHDRSERDPEHDRFPMPAFLIPLC